VGRGLRRWIGCDLGGYLIGIEESLGLWVGRLVMPMVTGYELFPGIRKTYGETTLYIAKSAFWTHGARLEELRIRWTGAVKVP
jgi:hypothetical protein